MNTITIDEDYCKGCSLCITVCPKEALVKGKRHTRKGYTMPDTHGDKCNGCQNCELVCPDFAISIGEEN